jgi:tetratricopeptide (TPR) repeat protein
MKKYKLMIFVSLLILTLSGQGLYSQEGRGSGRLKGSVVDEAGNPIEGAKIVLQYVQLSNRLTTTSNKQGQWGFIGLGKGVVTITVDKEGFIQALIQLPVSGIEKNPPQKIVMQKAKSGVSSISDSSKEMLLQGDTLFEQKKFAEALALFQEFVEKNPKLYQVRLNVANCYIELQEYDKAVAEYQKVLEELNVEPADKRDNKLMARLYAGIGDVYLKQNKLKEAEEYFVKSIDIDPADYALAYNVAEILMNANNTDGAIRYYEMAIHIKPDWPKSYLKLGYAWLNKGNNQKAIDAFNKLIEISPPDDPDAALAKDIIKNISKIK